MRQAQCDEIRHGGEGGKSSCECENDGPQYEKEERERGTFIVFATLDGGSGCRVLNQQNVSWGNSGSWL